MRQVMAVIRFNFRGFFRNPKVILTFLLGLVLSFLLSSRVMVVIEAYKTPTQAAEPFLWTFGDATAVLLTSLLLLLLFSDLPKLTAAVPFYLLRMTKRKWLLGQLGYVICVTAVYTVFIFLSTVVLCMKTSYAGDIWSETAAMLAYSKLGKDLGVPSTVKVMESMTPYGCVIQVIALLFLYASTLSFVILAGNLLLGRNRGMVLGLFYSLYGFLLDPAVLGKLLGLETYEMYKVNVFVVWVSPLNQAVYGRHNFGYDRLPTVRQSCLLFLLLLLILACICMAALGHYQFYFTGEKT
ncbi:MAG: hypothetical protein Q4C77_18245 [Eubacteriales bacterium]|nr:hypothetical protein [Eubacteriales bacterium]